MSVAAARMAWCTPLGNRDLETSPSSSASLLHSIYGSQDSQLLFTKYCSSSGEEEVARPHTPDLQLTASPACSSIALQQRRKLPTRPKSSPASTMAARMQQQKVQYVAGKLTLLRTPLNLRPESSHVVDLSLRGAHHADLTRETGTTTGTTTGTRPSLNRRVPAGYEASTRPRCRRPSSASVSRPQRPPSAATAQRRSSSNRPKTALGINRKSSSLLIDLEESEFEVEEAPLIRSTPPVNLTNQVEYFNFWLGKPLQERDSGAAVHRRKAWTRPKSDYGNRRRAGASGDDGGKGRETGLETVTEVDVEGLDSGSNKMGNRDEADGNHQGDKGLSDLQDDQDGKNGSKDDGTNGNQEKLKKKPHRSGNKGSKKSRKGTKKKVTLKAVSGTLSEADEDDYFGKSHPESAPWLEPNSTSSPCNSRFELPVDLRTLSEMTPLQYLRKHCVISKRWKTYCAPIFAEYDTDKDFKLNVEELKTGLIKAHHYTITLDQVLSVLEIVQVPSDFMVDVKLFAGFCCLTERLFDLYSIHRPIAQKDVIEKVDFQGLNWKLRDCHVNIPLHTLLTYL